MSDLIRHYINIQRYEKAHELINDLLSKNPHDQYALYLRAFCFYEEEKFKDSLDVCFNFLSEITNERYISLLIARNFIETENLNEARKFITGLLEENPEDTEALTLSAYLYYLNGESENSIFAIKKALEIDPENANALYYKFFINMKENNKNEARDSLENFIKYGTSETSKLYVTSSYEFNHGNYKAACESYRNLLIMEPGNEYYLKMLKKSLIRSNPLFLPIRWFDGIGVLFISVIVILLLIFFRNLTFVTFTLIGIYSALMLCYWFCNIYFKFFSLKK